MHKRIHGLWVAQFCLHLLHQLPFSRVPPHPPPPSIAPQVDLLLFYTPLGLGKLGESWSVYSYLQVGGGPDDGG